MLFTVACNEVLEEIRDFAITNYVEEAETLLAALPDDTTLIRELKPVIHQFQKLAKEKYDLDFHRDNCVAHSPLRTVEQLREDLKQA